MWSRGVPELRQELEGRRRAAVARVDAADPETLRFSLESVVTLVLASSQVGPIVIDWGSIERSQPREETLSAEEFGERYDVPGQRYDFYVPATGHVEFLRMQASTSSLGPELVFDYSDGQIRFSVAARTLDAAQIKAAVEQRKKELDLRVEWVNHDVETWNRELESAVRAAAEARRVRLDQAAAASDELDIPVRSAPGRQQVPLPIERRSVRVTERRPRADTRTAPEPRIADAIYADVVRTIRTVGNSFERLPRTAAKFKEPELRDLLLFILNSNYEGGARGEVFNGSGKTDILISHEDRNVFIGECKIWTGEKKFGEAIDQLAGYTVWRDTKAALILFVRQRDASAVIAKADAVIRGHRSFNSARAAGERESRADYLLESLDDPVRRIQLALLPVVLRPSDDTGA